MESKFQYFNAIQIPIFLLYLKQIISVKLKKIVFNKSPLFLAVEKGNIEIVKLLLTNYNLDINTISK